VKYHHLSDIAWREERFVARPLSSAWPGAFRRPALAVSHSRLVVASRNLVDSYTFHSPQIPTQSPQIRNETSATLGGGAAADVITSVAPVHDPNGAEFYIGLASGIIARTSVDVSSSGTLHLPPVTEAVHLGDSVLALSSKDDTLLSVSQHGIATVSIAGCVETLDLKTRAWICHLSTNHATFGLTSKTPLKVHDIRPSGISTQPAHILDPTSQDTHSKSAVFGICSAPPRAAWGSEQVIVSGWYNGSVNIHDLRTSTRRRDPSSPSSVPHLLPVLSFVDPSVDPIYCVATGGGSSSYVAAGLARHGMVAFWDIRNSRSSGWSVYAPGNDSSPVYSMVLESSRLFVVTQARPFVYDFGQGVVEDTFPPFRSTRAETRALKKQEDGPGYYVTTWRHSQLP
jgi:WD40 repeat protein